MNKWVKFGVACLLAFAAYFVGYETLGLYGQLFAFVFVGLSFVAVYVGSRVNWKLLFHKPRELYSLREWKPKAIAALEANYPGRVQGELYTEAEILYSVPVGLIWCVESPNVPLHERRCAFGTIYKDTKVEILSPLDTLQFHLRKNFCKSASEVGKLYLKKEDVLEQSLFKNEKKKVEEVAVS